MLRFGKDRRRVSGFLEKRQSLFHGIRQPPGERQSNKQPGEQYFGGSHGVSSDFRWCFDATGRTRRLQMRPTSRSPHIR